MLSRLGISISIHAVHDAINSLSAEAEERIRELGQTLLAGYGYDNLDVEEKQGMRTVEQSQAPSLRHLTSGIIFSLPPGTTTHHLQCSKELWERSRLNDTLPDNRANIASLPDWRNLLRIHPQHQSVDAQGMTCRDRFNSRQFLEDLLFHGPVYFRKFQAYLPPLELVDSIPLTGPTTILSTRTMDIPNSTVSGNGNALKGLASQAGIGDPNDETADEDVVDISEFVQLFLWRSWNW